MARKLIAQRPIQYFGRTYARGAALPTNDAVMLEAWLRAGSAVWTEELAGQASPLDMVRRQEAAMQAAELLDSLGVDITGEDGTFVGEEDLKEQLRILGQSLMQDYDDLLRSDSASQGEDAECGMMGTDADGRYTQSSLSRLNKAELVSLADAFGVDLSSCRTKPEQINALLLALSGSHTGGGTASEGGV